MPSTIANENKRNNGLLFSFSFCLIRATRATSVLAVAIQLKCVKAARIRAITAMVVAVR